MTKHSIHMKKIYTILTALLLVALCQTAAHAQYEEGKWFLNAQLSGLDISKWSFSMEDSDESSDFTQFGLNVSGGRYFQDNMAAVVSLGYLSVSQEDGMDVTAYSISAGVRRHFGSHFFGGAALSMNSINLDSGWGDSQGVNAFMFGVNAGYAIYISERVAIEPGINYAIKFAGKIKMEEDDYYYKSDDHSSSDGIGFDLSRMGFSVGITIGL
jgi:hypothetical protein